MPDQPSGHNPAGDTDGQPPPPPPVEPTIEQRVMALESKSYAYTTKDDTSKEMKREFRLVEIFTIATNVILAVVGIFALHAYYGQLGAMQGQLDEMSRQFPEIQKSANAAADAAIADKMQAANAEIFFRVDERAWVEIEKVEKIDTFPPDPPFATIFKYSFSVKNFGKTVAKDVRIRLDNMNGETAFESNQRAIRMYQDSLWRDGKSGRRIVTPDKPGPQTIVPSGAFTIPVYSVGQEPTQSGGKFTYGFMLGRIDYTDAFETNHWVRFCFMIVNSKGELGHCQYGNDEDHNPEKEPLPH